MASSKPRRVSTWRSVLLEGLQLGPRLGCLLIGNHLTQMGSYTYGPEAGSP